MNGDFWTVIEFLVSVGTKAELLFFEDVDEWLDSITLRVRLQFAQKRAEDNTLNRRFSVEEEMSRFAKFFKSNCISSISYPVVKTKLEMLLGSNIVRLTDRKYMLKLMTKLRNNHEKLQQKRIEERKREELMRTKNMILHRLIPVQEAPAELRQYPLFKLYLYCDDLRKKIGKSRIPKKVKMPKSLYQSLYPEVIENEIKNEKDKNIDDSEECQEDVKQESQELTDEETMKDLQGGYLMSEEDYDRLHYEAESVKRLRELQTIEELYKKAHEIIGSLGSYSDKQGKIIKQRPQQVNEEISDWLE